MDVGIIARGWAKGVAMHHAEEQRKAAQQAQLQQQQGYRAQDEARQFGYDVQKTNLEHRNRLDEIGVQQQGQQDVRKIIEEGLNSRNQGKGALTPEKYSQIFQRTHAEFLKQYDAPTALQLTQAALSGMSGMVGAGEPTAAPGTPATAPTSPSVAAGPGTPPPMPQPMGQSFPDVTNPTRLTSTDVRPPAGTVLDQKDAVIQHLVKLIQDPNANPALRAKAETELPQVRGRREELAGIVNPQTNAPPSNLSPKMQMDYQKNTSLNAYRTGSLDLRREVALLGSNDKAKQRDSMEKIARIISGDRAKSLQEKRAEFAQTLDLNRDKFDVDQQQFAEDLKYKYFSQEQENQRAATRGAGGKPELYNAKVNQLRSERSDLQNRLQHDLFDTDEQSQNARSRIAAINQRLQELATEQDRKKAAPVNPRNPSFGFPTDTQNAPSAIPNLTPDYGTPKGAPGALSKPTHYYPKPNRPSRTPAKKRGKTMGDLFK